MTHRSLFRLAARSVALGALLTVASVACSAPTPAPAESTKEKATKGNEREEADDAAKDTNTGASDTDATGNTTPPSTTTPPTQNEEQADACFTQCVGTDPSVLAVDEAIMACNDKCTETNEACFANCDKTICVGAAQAHCEKIFGCDEKCFGSDQSQQ